MHGMLVALHANASFRTKATRILMFLGCILWREDAGRKPLQEKPS